MSQPSKPVTKPKYFLKLLGIVAAIIGVIAGLATILTLPEIRCFIGLQSDTCLEPQKEIELIVQSPEGQSLSGVKVQVMGIGAPEIQYTDNNGYAIVKIANKGTVRVSLEKKGYPLQDFTINLENDQNLVRIIKLNQSGEPSVQSTPSISSSPDISITPTSSFTPSIRNDQGILLDKIKDNLTSEDPKKRYSFHLSNPGIVSLYLDNVENEVWMGLYEDSGNGTPKNYYLTEDTATRSKPGAIGRKLNTGQYFVSIQRQGGDTAYTLLGINYTEKTKEMGFLKVDNSLSDGSTLSMENRHQYYRFNLGNPELVSLNLKDVQNETLMRLYKDNGEGLPASSYLYETTATSSQQGKIEKNLETGSYIVVISRGGGDTSYSLSIRVESQ